MSSADDALDNAVARIGQPAGLVCVHVRYATAQQPLRPARSFGSCGVCVRAVSSALCRHVLRSSVRPSCGGIGNGCRSARHGWRDALASTFAAQDGRRSLTCGRCLLIDAMLANQLTPWPCQMLQFAVSPRRRIPSLCGQANRRWSSGRLALTRVSSLVGCHLEQFPNNRRQS